MPRMIPAPDDPDEAAASHIGWGSLEEIAGFHVRMAQAAIYRDFCAKMKAINLSQTQYAVLVLVSANPGVSQIDLARSIGSDRATMMALVNRLELRRLVERTLSETDRRKQELRLTVEGAATLKRAAGVIAKHEKSAFAGLSADETATLVRLLKKVYLG